MIGGLTIAQRRELLANIIADIRSGRIKDPSEVRAAGAVPPFGNPPAAPPAAPAVPVPFDPTGNLGEHARLEQGRRMKGLPGAGQYTGFPPGATMANPSGSATVLPPKPLLPPDEKVSKGKLLPPGLGPVGKFVNLVYQIVTGRFVTAGLTTASIGIGANAQIARDQAEALIPEEEIIAIINRHAAGYPEDIFDGLLPDPELIASSDPHDDIVG